MGLFTQFGLSYRMTIAAGKMTLRYPQTILIALANLLLLVLVAVGPIATMIHLASNDPAQAWWALKYVFQFWFVADAFEAGDWQSGISLFSVWLLGIYMVWMTIVSFCSMACATIIMHTGVMQLRGEEPSLSEGFRLVGRNLWRLAGLALLAGAVLTLVKRALSTLKVIPLAGRIIRGAVAAALTGLLYAALPVVVYERAGPVAALRSTWTNMRQTWGGLVVGTGLMLSAVWVGLWFVWYAAAAAFEQLFGFTSVNWTTMLMLQLFGAVALYCVNVALSANLRAALYLHVTEGHTGVLPEGALVSEPPTRSPPIMTPGAGATVGPTTLRK